MLKGVAPYLRIWDWRLTGSNCTVYDGEPESTEKHNQRRNAGWQDWFVRNAIKQYQLAWNPFVDAATNLEDLLSVGQVVITRREMLKYTSAQCLPEISRGFRVKLHRCLQVPIGKKMNAEQERGEVLRSKTMIYEKNSCLSNELRK